MVAAHTESLVKPFRQFGEASRCQAMIATGQSRWPAMAWLVEPSGGRSTGWQCGRRRRRVARRVIERRVVHDPHPAQMLSETATTVGAGLIVLGTRGHRRGDDTRGKATVSTSRIPGHTHLANGPAGIASWGWTIRSAPPARATWTDPQCGSPPPSQPPSPGTDRIDRLTTSETHRPRTRGSPPPLSIGPRRTAPIQGHTSRRTPAGYGPMALTSGAVALRVPRRSSPSTDADIRLPGPVR